MTMEVQTHIADQVELKGAVLLYAGRDKAVSYATTHPISVVDGAAMIRPGKPLREGHLRRLVQELMPSRRAALALLPPHVLACDEQCVVWYRPARTQTVWMRASEPLGERCGPAPVPTLIFAACKQNLYVYAIKRGGRPQESTRLYHAPLLNVWESGHVCTGSMRLPKVAGVASIPQWEHAFWHSTFTHTNHSRVVRHEGGALALWRDLLDARDAHFPNAALVPSPIGRLGALIEKLAAGREL